MLRRHVVPCAHFITCLLRYGGPATTALALLRSIEAIMIFQASVALNINEKEVHVAFDMDTGMIGFTEISDGKHIEYSYQSCPPEFRASFAQLMDSLIGKAHQSNALICRKNGAYQALQEFWKNKNQLRGAANKCFTATDSPSLRG